jgi:hypothetical protein
MVLALTLLGSAAAANAATSQRLYRTPHQAELYLEHGLQTWNNDNLGKTDLRSAYCISGYSALPNADKHYPRSRVNPSGVRTFRDFACTLNVQAKEPGHVKGHSEVYGLYLVTTRTGWRVTALRKVRRA